jgi:hypothetical protein
LYCLVMRRWMMFSKVVRFVEDSFFPVNVKLALTNAVTNPVEAHVDGFGAFLLDSIVGDARGGAIIGL